MADAPIALDVAGSDIAEQRRLCSRRAFYFGLAYDDVDERVLDARQLRVRERMHLFYWMRESAPISYQEHPSIKTPSDGICSGFTMPTVNPAPEGTLLAVTIRTVTPLAASWER